MFHYQNNKPYLNVISNVTIATENIDRRRVPANVVDAGCQHYVEFEVARTTSDST